MPIDCDVPWRRILYWCPGRRGADLQEHGPGVWCCLCFGIVSCILSDRDLVLTQSFSYRLAPEHKFPAAPNDSWDALKWAAANAKSLKADPSQGFIIGGTSAGGNITAVLAHLARDEGLSPPLTGQYLAIPAVGGGQWIPEKYKDKWLSYEQNNDVPVLPIAAIDMFMNGYQPDENDHELCKFASSCLPMSEGNNHVLT